MSSLARICTIVLLLAVTSCGRPHEAPGRISQAPAELSVVAGPDNALEGIVEEVDEVPPEAVPREPHPVPKHICNNFEDCRDAIQCCWARGDGEKPCCDQSSTAICRLTDAHRTFLYCQPTPETDCMNGVDDNGNDLIDCEDPDCAGAACDASDLSMVCCPGEGCVPGGGEWD